MNDNFLNKTGLTYFWNRIKSVFASKTEVSEVDTKVDNLSDKVDEIIAEGGEPNTIETVKVNGTALTPDANKAVNVEVPEDLSDLTNTSADPYVTESYVDQNGGKIDKIKVNGTEQTITNKEVNITVPEKTSDLTNDDNFQTDTDVDSAISTALANGNDPYVTDSEVDTKINTALTSAMTYKGTVATYNDLPASGNKIGDFYNVTADDKNYAWDGTKWDGISGTIDTSTLWAKSELVAITTAEIDTITA